MVGLLQRSLVASALAGVGLVLSSCGGGSGGSADAAGESASQTRSLDDYQYSKNDVVYGKAGTDEEGMIVGGRRSQFEGKRQVVFGGEFEGKNFATSKYKAGSWKGKRDYGRQAYGGNTDGSRFQVASSMEGQQARASGQQSSYAGRIMPTTSYGTSAAREAGATNVRRETSHFADDRFPMPQILPLRDYQKRTMQETNRLLGKEP